MTAHEWTDVTVLKLVENDQTILFEEVAADWNPHADLDDPAVGPTAIGEQYGAGVYYLLDNTPRSVHPDPHETEYAYVFRIVEEDVNTTVTYSYHIL
jgi:hypothetical protein